MTNDIERRTWEHKEGVVEGFSKQYGCNRLVFFEKFDDVRSAIDREKQIKGWTRARKIALIQAENPRWEDLAASWGRPILMRGEKIGEREARLRKMSRLEEVEMAGRKA